MQKPSIFQYTNPSGKVVWKVDVQTGVHPNGKPVITRRTAKTRAEARAIGQELLLQVSRGQMAPQGREHFRSFALRWLEEVKAPQVRRATSEDYRYKLEHFLFPVFGERPIRDISSADVSRFLKSLQERGLANYTINGIRQVLGAVLKAGEAFGAIGKNPVSNVPRYRQSRRNTVLVQEPWTRGEAQEALQAIRGTSVELFGSLLIYLGLRKSEALGLKWNDFNFEQGTLTINRSIREVGIFQPDGNRRTEIVEEEPKTRASQRTLLISRPLLEVIHRHRGAQENRRLFEPDSWVLATKNGTLPRPSNLQRQLNQCLADRGVRRIRVHDIRHTAIVMALESGTPIEAVSQGAGHSRLDTTKTIYAPYSQTLANRFASDVSNYLNKDEIDRQIEDLLTSEVAPGQGSSNWGGS